MVIEIAGMGVEHSMGTAAAPQLRIAAGKAVDRLPGDFKSLRKNRLSSRVSPSPS
jgi:hypothetical protein